MGRSDERSVEEILKKLSEGVEERFLTPRFRCGSCRDTGFVIQRAMGSRGYEVEQAVRCGGCNGAEQIRKKEAEDWKRRGGGDVEV